MSTTPGWHPDPSGRHQHRFWDGSTWTDQVADNGVTGHDPLAAAGASGGGAGAGHPGAGGPPSYAAEYPSAPPDRTSSKAPLFIGLAVVVALVAAGLVFVLTGDDDSSADGSGPGDFTYDVGSERFTVHEVSLKAGDAVAFRASDLGSTKVASGISRADLDRVASIDGLISDTENFTDVYSDSNQSARDLFSDLSDPSDEQAALINLLSEQTDGYVALPNFDGVLLERVDYDAFGKVDTSEAPDGNSASSFFVAPADITVSIVMIAEAEERDVTLQVRTQASPDPVTIASSDEYDELLSEAFNSDFYSELSSEFSSDDTGSGGN